MKYFLVLAALVFGGYFFWPTENQPAQVPTLRPTTTSLLAPPQAMKASKEDERSWLIGSSLQQSPFGRSFPQMPPLTDTPQNPAKNDKNAMLNHVKETISAQPELQREINNVEIKDGTVMISGPLGYGDGRSGHHTAKLVQLFEGTPGIKFEFFIRPTEETNAAAR